MHGFENELVIVPFLWLYSNIFVHRMNYAALPPCLSLLLFLLFCLHIYIFLFCLLCSLQPLFSVCRSSHFFNFHRASCACYSKIISTVFFLFFTSTRTDTHVGIFGRNQRKDSRGGEFSSHTTLFFAFNSSTNPKTTKTNQPKPFSVKLIDILINPSIYYTI